LTADRAAKIDTVDDFVRQKVALEFAPVVALLRQVMGEVAPGAVETISYGMPVWKGNRIFAFISPTKKDVTLGFSRGTRFEDRYGLLGGRGRVSRHLKFRTVEAIKKTVLRYYIRQALQLDEQ